MQIIQMAFPEGKTKAFTVSYDDGVRQDERLLAAMRKYGIRGTFNLNYGTLGRVGHAVIDGRDTDISTFRAEELQTMYEGQEIACHALTHKKLTEISAGTAACEVIEDRRNLEHVLDRLVTGFAYPFGVYDETVLQVLRSCGIRYARTVESTHAFGLPQEFLTWHPTCHHNDERVTELLETFCGEPAGRDGARLFYLWGHAYEFDQRDNWERAEEIFSYVNRYGAEIWFATNGEIRDYTEAFRRLEFSADGGLAVNRTALDVWLLADGSAVCVPAGETVRLN